MKYFFLSLTLFSLAAASCSDDHQDTEQLLLKQRAEFENFEFPDSIRQKYVVATFYDIHNPAYGAIYLTDSMGKNAIMARYTPDGHVLMDSLWRKSSAQFVSITSKAEYALSEKTVNYFSGNFGSEQVRNGQMYLRTDHVEE